jgi:hypothetical protein
MVDCGDAKARRTAAYARPCCCHQPLVSSARTGLPALRVRRDGGCDRWSFRRLLSWHVVRMLSTASDHAVRRVLVVAPPRFPLSAGDPVGERVAAEVIVRSEL